MQLKHLETFMAVVNTGGFSAAARTLGLTQSAVSQQIKALEISLGTVLFDRFARPPKLTVRGRSLAEQARRIVSLCEQAVALVGSDEVAGSFYLGVIRAGLLGVLPDALANLRARHPGLKVIVSTGDAVDLIAGVANNRLDAAILPEIVSIPPGLRWGPLFVEPFIVIAPIDTQGDSDKELLEARPYIHFSRQVRTSRLIDVELERRGIRLSREMEIDSFPTIALMVARGLGVSVVPQQAIGRVESYSVRSLPFGNPHMSRVVGMIERQASDNSASVALSDEIRRLSSFGWQRP